MEGVTRTGKRMMDLKGSPWTFSCMVITLALLLSLGVLCSPVAAGVNPQAGRTIPPGGSAIIGETNLSFKNDSGAIIPSGVIQCSSDQVTANIYFEGPFDSSNYEDELSLGRTRIIPAEGYGDGFDVYFSLPKLDVTTEVNGEAFAWVTRGGEITFKGVTNLRVIRDALPNYIDFSLLEPTGRRRSEVNGVSLSQIDVSGSDTTFLVINTTGMRTGVYTLSIETDPSTNNGLDTEGPEVSFEVRSKGITIVPDEEKKTVTEEIVFTLSTTPHTTLTIDVTWGISSKVKFLGIPPPIQGVSDKEGKLVIGAFFTETGSFEITATEGIMGTTDSIFVEIVPYEAEVTLDKDPPLYHIGENVKITGSATAGDSITLAIDDEVVATDLDVDGFDYTWKTENLAPNIYKIAIWVVGEDVIFPTPLQDPPDDSVSVILIRGGLFVEPSVPFVALGDEFTIDGIVPGRDRVYILTIAPDGGGGQGLDPTDLAEDTNSKLSAPGLTYETAGVDTDGEFETEKIAVSKDVDTGTYLIAALNYGRDGVWGESRSSDLLGVISNNYSLRISVKTIDELLEILKDKTINAPGTDDLLGIVTISVEQGFVTVDDLEDVLLGGDITVTGTTNRQVDTSIIVTVESLEATGTKLKPKIAKVEEDEKTYYNTFEISFDTESANIGKYAVTVDDGDGHIASTTVSILPAEEPSVNVSTTPSPKTAQNGSEAEVPTSNPGSTPLPLSPSTESEGSAKEPGFGALLAFTVLAILGFLLVRSREKR